MTAIHDKKGFRFLYPENWQIFENQETDMVHEVSLETPDGGIWALNVFPAAHEPKNILDSAIEALSEQFEEVEITSVEDDSSDHVAAARDAHFHYLDFVVAAQFRVYETPQNKLLVWYQAESREFDQQRLVFHAITTSLLESVFSTTGSRS